MRDAQVWNCMSGIPRTDLHVRKNKRNENREVKYRMKRIGIIGAMEIEVAQLKTMMENIVITTKAGMDFYAGTINGKEVVVVQSGIGKVNAGMCTQILADLYQVDAVINTGVAGSLRNEINIGDIVISTTAVQHDMDVTPLGYQKGFIPGMKELAFAADQELSQLAVATCQEVNPDIQVYTGIVATGDQFIASREVKDSIISCFEASCTEMEGGAIAQAAFLNQIPFVIIRAISDKADNSAQMDYPEFERQAVEHTVRLLDGMLKKL